MSGFTKVNKDVVCDIINTCGNGQAMTYIMILTHNNASKGLDGCFPSYSCLEKELHISKPTILV